MRSKVTVDPKRVENIERSYLYDIELEGEKRIAARCSADRNIMDVRSSDDISRLRNIIQDVYLQKALYVDDDFALSKKLCYDIAKLVEVEHCGQRDSLTYPLVASIDYHLRASFILFSDHQPLIRKFLDFDYAMYGDTEQDIRTRWRQVERGPALYAYTMYSLANGDFARIERCTEVATRLHNKGEHKKAHLDIHIAIWQAILERDKDKLNKNLLDLIRKAHWSFNPKIDFDGHFISSPAVGYLKAAWLLGLEVEVDHKYVPMEMMPYQPLSVYEKRYWFLLDD
jgi:hypothetical protein